MRPISYMLFRPEEVHAASGHTPGYFSRQNLGEGDIHMSHGRRWIDFQDILVTHADENGLPTIQATGVDTDLSTREEPAHGQHFEPSLAVPILVPLYSHKIMGRYIRKRRPGLDVICVFNKPAAYRRFGCLMLYLPRLFGSQPESCCKFGIVWGSPSLHKVLHNSSVSSLHQGSFLHIIPSCLVLMACGCEATHHAVSYPILYRFLNWLSLNHFIRSRQHIRCIRQVDLLFGFQVYVELELRRLLDRQVSRLSSFENLVDQPCGAPVGFSLVGTVRHQATALDIISFTVNRRQPMFCRE